MINAHDTWKSLNKACDRKKYKSETDIPDSHNGNILLLVQAAVISSSLQTKELQLS